MIAELNKEAQDPTLVSAYPEAGERVTAKGSPAYRCIKRVFDVTVSLCAGLILLIPMILVGILIRIDSPGPAIFRQERMGKHGKTFIIYKFRTMRVEAPNNMPTHRIEETRGYITKVGAVLRRTSIDELPQLFNVLRGDMSIVGYRPVCLCEEELNALRSRLGVFAVRPGITGLAQVNGRDHLGFREKARLDAEYVQSRSIKLDLWCLVKTVSIVLSGEGVK